MRILRPIAILLITTLFIGSASQNKNLSCKDVVEHMLDSIKNIKSQTCNIKATERIGDHFLIAESFIKINVYPRKIYFHSPEKGVEMLWVQSSNNGNAIVHSKSIPLLNFDLDPLGSIVRKDQHHTIFELGTTYIGSIIANTILKSPKEFDKHFTYGGTVKWDNKDCYQIIMNFPEYKYIEYITKKEETVSSIAQKLNTSDYKIRFKNDLSSYYGSIKEGKKLTIPIPYSNKALFFVDKKTFIPIYIIVYDEEGLYESYEFKNIRINVPFKPDEFSKDFKGYGF